jgi:hypothetical protein
MGFLKNAATSAGHFTGDIYNAVTNPGQTLEGVTNVLQGMSEKSGFAPVGGGVSGAPHAPYVDALVDLFKNRYGSLDSLKHTLYTDPVGVAADVATLASGTGMIAKGVELGADVAKLGTLSNVAATTAKTAGLVSEFADPLRLSAKIAETTGISPAVANFLKTRIMKSALKGGYATTKDAADVEELARTAIDAGIPVSKGGLDKLNQYLEDLRQAVATRVGAGAQAGATIPRTALEQAATAGGVKYGQTLGAGPNLRNYNKRVAEIMSEFQNPDIPVDLAQTKKTATYAQHPEAFGPEAAIPPEQRPGLAATRNITLAIKDELEKALPELTSLNPQQQKLLNLQPVLQSAVNKYLNSGGFTSRMAKLVSAGAGLGGAASLIPGVEIGGLGAAGGGGVAALYGVLSDPYVQSRLASAINTAQKANPARWGGPQAATAMSRVQNYVKALAPQAPDVTFAPSTIKLVGQ